MKKYSGFLGCYTELLSEFMYMFLFGPTYENGSWWIKTNQELDKLIKYKNVMYFARAQS